MCIPNPPAEGISYDIPPLKVTDESLACRYMETPVVFGEFLEDGRMKVQDCPPVTQVAASTGRTQNYASWTAMQSRLLERLSGITSSS